jgi:Uma2 family endonuclease
MQEVDMKTDGTSALANQEHFCYGDLKTWPEGERWELIDGQAYAMSPAPRRLHQKLALKIAAILQDKLEGKPCEAYISPIDVFLPEHAWKKGEDSLDSIDLVVQPDILVVCDQEKLIDEGILGAPDLAIEILSPSTAWKDLTDKRLAFERHRVREYWIVNPDTFEVHVYRLSTPGTLDGKADNASYGLPQVLDLRQGIEVGVLPGIVIQVAG